MKRRTGVHWRARLEQIRRQAKEAAASPEARDNVLRRRAELLARPEHSSDASDGQAIMILTTGGERYALPLEQVSEVITDAPVAPVPGAPPQVAGVIQVRGDLRPVFDLARMLGHPAAAAESNTVVLFRRQGREMGFRVESVEDIRWVMQDERRAAPGGAAHAAWITADLVMVVDMDSLLEGNV